MLRLVRLGVVPSILASLSLAMVAACATAPDRAADVEATGSLASALTTSASTAGVPRDLLVAIAKVEDGLTLPAQRLHIDADNEVPAAGPLQLRRGKLDTLRRGAELTGTTEIELRRDADLALRAGALVLAELAARTGARADDLASWSEAIEEMSGFADDARREHYAHQVFATLARGGTFEGRDGERIVLPPHDLPPTLTLDVSSKLRVLADNAEYPGAEWIPTSCSNNKCSAGRGDETVQLVLVHDTEGNWNASVATLQNDPGKSVQYIIDVDGRVGQFITEDTTGYHAGNIIYNRRSIGIEHVGYSTKPFPEPLYAASAKLVDHLATKYAIPRDRAHIIGHDQVPDGKKVPKDDPPCSGSPAECQSGPYGGASHHGDPGIWEWASYMARFGGTAKCNDAPSVLTCAQDKKQAFRCNAGTFELLSCDGTGGCEPAPSADASAATVDAVCNVAPKATPPKTDETPPAPKPTPPAPAAEPPPLEPDDGCAAAPGPVRGGAGLVLAACAALALAARRRRA